ncbi:MAG: hypothetical protein V4707_06120 [Pseudomonadota bacterium]
MARDPSDAALVEGFFWPPWIEVAAGGCGIAFALWSINRRMDGKPMHADARKADKGLLIFGCLLVVIGLVRLAL